MRDQMWQSLGSVMDNITKGFGGDGDSFMIFLVASKVLWANFDYKPIGHWTKIDNKGTIRRAKRTLHDRKEQNRCLFILFKKFGNQGTKIQKSLIL